MKTVMKENNTASESKFNLSDKSKDYQVRLEALFTYVYSKDPGAFDFLKTLVEDTHEDEHLKENIVREIGNLQPKRHEIDEYLLQITNDGRYTSAAIQSLARRGTEEAIPLIIKEILNSPDNHVRDHLAKDLRYNYDLKWEERLKLILEEIESSNIRSESIDASPIAEAIINKEATTTQNKDHIIDKLITQSIDQNKRMTGVIAKLIIELSSKSQSIAGQKVSEFIESTNTPPHKFRKLRIMIGGDTAIDPLIGLLHDNLETYFQKPIHNLNDDTHQNWKKTIQYAQYGFLMRMVMSVVVFIIGILLLCISSYEFFLGDSSGDELYGVGISFAAGIGTMLAVIYTGPLRQIRESVNDLGIASAAFIAYVHRVLEISHTFSFYYLNQKITFEEMDKSSDLIDKAMKNTIELLSDKSAKID